MMNVARRMIFIAIGCFACIGAKAQVVNCTTSTKLVCLIPFLTKSNLVPGNGAETSYFNAPIGSQLSQLPLAASAPGAIILTIHGNPEVYNNLGPVLVDRPDSVGQGHLVAGFSFQQFNFNHLNGTGIGSVPLVYQLTSGSSPQYYSQTNHTSLKYNQYVLLATYGFPQKTDVSVIVPYIRVSIGVAALNANLYAADSGFSKTPTTGGYTSGSASGPGDVVLNVKHVLWGGEAGRGSLAAGAAFRFPTGDALNYLGSGAYGFNLYGLAAYKAPLSPHVKVAYQWNTNSVLLNISGTGPNQSLPGGVQFAVGADYGASRRLTLSADILATEFQNAPSISVTTYGKTINGAAIPAAAAAVGTLSTVNNVNTTFMTANFSGGLKWKPFARKNLVLYGNVLIQVNDVGLRSDPSPSGGISYNFRANKWPNWLYRSPDHL